MLRISEDAELLSFPVTEEAFACRPYGRRGYTYWLSSPDYELMLGARRSSRRRSCSCTRRSCTRWGSMRRWTRWSGCSVSTSSRGRSKRGCRGSTCTRTCRAGSLRTADLDRFVGYGRHRRAFEDNRQVFQSGSGCRASCSARTPWWRGSTTRRRRSASTASAGCPTCGARTSTRARRSGVWSSSSAVRRWPTSRRRRWMR